MVLPQLTIGKDPNILGDWLKELSRAYNPVPAAHVKSVCYFLN